MFKRYDLDVFYNDVPIYAASFSSINHLVKFACGFDTDKCRCVAFDSVFENYVPLDELCNEFRSNVNGI